MNKARQATGQMTPSRQVKSRALVQSNDDQARPAEAEVEQAIVETRYGTMRVPEAGDNVVVRFLQVYGEWAELEVRFIADNLPPHARVADIGAFLGTFGTSLPQHVDVERVCFVEANATIAPLLRANVAANCRAESTVVEAVVCPTGQASLQAYRHPGNEGSVSFVARAGAEPAPDLPVPAARTSLIALWEQQGPFDLLKLDIEGMELSALRESRDLFAKHRFAVWAECNEEPSSIDLADFLLSCGLRVFYFAFPSHNPDNFRGERRAVFPFAYEAGLYASEAEPRLDPDLVSRGCLFAEIHDREALREALWSTPRNCPPGIADDRAAAALATALRMLQGTNYENFLSDPRPSPSDGGEDKGRPSDDPEAIVATHSASIEEARAHLAQANQALNAAQRLAVERTAERNAARDEGERLNRTLMDVRALLDERTKERDDLSGTMALAEIAVARRTAELDRANDRLVRTERELLAVEGRARWAEDVAEDRQVLLSAQHQARQDVEAQLVAGQQTRRLMEAQIEAEQRAQQDMEARLVAEQRMRQDVEAQLAAEQRARQEIETQLAAAEEYRQAAELHLAGLIQSKSWRMTSPFRAASRLRHSLTTDTKER